MKESDIIFPCQTNAWFFQQQLFNRQAMIPRHDFYEYCWWKEVPKKEETNHKEEEEDEPLVKDTAAQNP